MTVCRTTRIMEKYFKRLPKENEEWKSKNTSKNDNMEKAKDGEDAKKIKKSSSEYRAEKITGFNNENVHEKIKLMEAHPPKGDWCKFDHVYIKTTTLTQKWTNKVNEKTFEVYYLSPWGTKNSIKQKLMAEVCKNSPPTEVVTAQELDAKVDKTKINIEVKDNGKTKVEKYHCIYCVHCQNNLVPALLEHKSQFIFEEHNITTLINKWDD